MKNRKAHHAARWKVAAKAYREAEIHATKEYVTIYEELLREQCENFDLRAENARLKGANDSK